MSSTVVDSRIAANLPTLDDSALHAAAAVHGRRRTGAHRSVAKPSSADAEVVTRLRTALPDVGVTLGMDGACPGEATKPLSLKKLAGRAGPMCVLDCPKLNSTRAVEVCFNAPPCIAVDLTFNERDPSAQRMMLPGLTACGSFSYVTAKQSLSPLKL